jgi:PKD repeat protein
MPGNYDVTLTHNRPITSINAYTGATVTTINTQEITLPVATLNEISPKASISASKTGGVIPLDIEFTAVDSIPGSFTIDKFVWDFGDGITETSFLTSGTVNHIYNSAASNLTVSVTAFSSFTKTCGVTSLDIGPLTVPSLTSVSFDILKVRNTPHGNVYAVDINNSLTFIKSNI